MSQLSEDYKNLIVPNLMKQFGYKTIMQVPKLEKITLNMGLGSAAQDKKIIDVAIDQLSAIAGQKAVVTKARKSVASFKIREGWPIGCKVVLRAHNMYEFFKKLVSIALPRVRDFRGLNPKSFDGNGNYNFGINELIVFPEIGFDKMDSKIKGLDICLTTSANTDEEAKALLLAFNMPIKH
jgi:large subunit ribosomal protein L5